MKNIFKDAKFGDKFLTRNGKIAIYYYHSEIGKYHSLIIKGEDYPCKYMDFTNGIINLPLDPNPDENYNTPIDIVSKLNGWVDNKERDLYFERMDWSMTYYDVILKDGTMAEVATFYDEGPNGAVCGIMEFTDESLEEKYSVFKDILVWKLKENQE